MAEVSAGGRGGVAILMLVSLASRCCGVTLSARLLLLMAAEGVAQPPVRGGEAAVSVASRSC